MNLVDVYSFSKIDAIGALFWLLKERTEDQSISHKSMPLLEDHVRFIQSKPYRHWYLIVDNCECVGAVYLSKKDEIGIGVYKEYQGKGYAKQAILELVKLHPLDKYFANINPRNTVSIKLFESLGFAHVQNTYEL